MNQLASISSMVNGKNIYMYCTVPYWPLLWFTLPGSAVGCTSVTVASWVVVTSWVVAAGLVCTVVVTSIVVTVVVSAASVANLIKNQNCRSVLGQLSWKRKEIHEIELYSWLVPTPNGVALLTRCALRHTRLNVIIPPEGATTQDVLQVTSQTPDVDVTAFTRLVCTIWERLTGRHTRYTSARTR